MITGNAANDWFGDSVSSAGDINKDGYGDIIIGASLKDSQTGAAYVVYGGEKSSMSDIDLSTEIDPTKGFSILGTAHTRFGVAVSKIDINSDGYSELLIGTMYESKVYILMFYKCPENCDQCDSETECKVCKAGYGLDNQNLCEACTPENCLTCNTDYNSCESCKTDYLVSNGECIESCSDGTFPDSGKCTNCPIECSICNSLSSCQDCVDGYELSGSQCVKIKVEEPPKTEEEEEIEEKGGEKAAAGAFEGVSIVGSSLSSGSSLPLNFGLVSKILRNIKYMKLPVSQELYETFYSWKVASGFMSAPESWSGKYNAKIIPVVFSRYKLQSAFLINFWKPLMMTLIGVAAFGLFKMIEVNMGKKKIKEISKQINIAASNFALTQFYSNLDDVLFYFILEMRSTRFETSFRVCSSLLAVFLFLVGAGFMIMHSQILGKYQKIKEAKSTPQLEDFVSKFANVNLIFKDFKDTNSLTQAFLMINVGRSALSSLIFATLFEYPMIQISFLIVLNLLMIVYLWNLKSFQDFTNTCSQMFCEGILFIANICVFLLALFDHADSSPTTTIKILGKCIIGVNLILLVGCALLMLIGIGKMLYKVYKGKKKMPQQEVLQPPRPLQIEKLISTKFTRPSDQNLSKKIDLTIEESQKEFQLNSSQNTLETHEEKSGYLNRNSNGRNQQEIFKNYSIHHPARNQNPSSFETPIESLEISSQYPGLQPSQILDFGETSSIQPNPLSIESSFPRSRLMRNREITKARIAQFAQRENNSNYGTPESGIQDLSFHSRQPLNQDSCINQDVSLIHFD